MLNGYIKELKHLEDRYKDLSAGIDGNKMIQRLRQTSVFWRERAQNLRKQLVAKEERENGEPFAWRMCEICLREYGQEEDHTPRFLGGFQFFRVGSRIRYAIPLKKHYHYAYSRLRTHSLL